MNLLEVQTCINLYKKEIHATRKHKKRILESEYILLKKILRLVILILKIYLIVGICTCRLWKDLKIVRDNQGYSSTTTWLEITK